MQNSKPRNIFISYFLKIPLSSMLLFQGGQPFNAKIQDDNSLVLTAVDVFNNGTYVCKASNEIGTASESADLIISSEPTHI